MTSMIVILTALLQTLALLAFVVYASTRPTSKVDQSRTPQDAADHSFTSSEMEEDVTALVCAPLLANILPSPHVQQSQGNISESGDAQLASADAESRDRVARDTINVKQEPVYRRGFTPVLRKIYMIVEEEEEEEKVPVGNREDLVKEEMRSETFDGHGIIAPLECQPTTSEDESAAGSLGSSTLQLGGDVQVHGSEKVKSGSVKSRAARRSTEKTPATRRSTRDRRPVERFTVR